ncbi:hypothetical protein DFH07DRAFT_794885 [Mycena maculata]|uniref:Zn(2)-C6 fungal-type domain-containing protein n=1 Tax=Mycena maculata TaxID=230809 RepID=A0AAD7NXV0_9AGAR|nr:hypothetical protein DFH07DRAFT_794885 [Mycena maculata]
MSISNPASSQLSAPYALRRRRTIIACLNCRTKKMRCVTTEQPPRNPCARCTRRRIPCEYVSVPEQEAYLASTPANNAVELPHLGSDSAPQASVRRPRRRRRPMTAPEISGDSMATLPAPSSTVAAPIPLLPRYFGRSLPDLSILLSPGSPTNSLSNFTQTSADLDYLYPASTTPLPSPSSIVAPASQLLPRYLRRSLPDLSILTSPGSPTNSLNNFTHATADLDYLYPASRQMPMSYPYANTAVLQVAQDYPIHYPLQSNDPRYNRSSMPPEIPGHQLYSHAPIPGSPQLFTYPSHISVDNTSASSPSSMYAELREDGYYPQSDGYQYPVYSPNAPASISTTQGMSPDGLDYRPSYPFDDPSSDLRHRSTYP